MFLRMVGGRFIQLSQIQFRQFSFNLREAALHKGALVSAETTEGLGHKVVANTEAGERAFDALDDRGGILADAIERIADALDLLLQFLRAGKISGAMRFDHLDIKFREQICSARTSRAKLEISPSDIEKLPKALQPFLSVQAAHDGFQALDLNRWSLITTGAPIYPEDRFQFGVAVDVVRQCNLKSFRIAVAGQSDRWTGKRAWQIVTRQDELDRLADYFRLNTHSRSAR